MGNRLRVAGRELPGGLSRVTIGRDEGADIVVDSPLVSRLHARLELEPRGWVYRDLDSRNGSFVAGERITELRIEGDVQVRLGGVDGPELSLELLGTGVVGTQVGDLGRLSAIHRVQTGELKIGREPENDLVIDDLRVSRRHARLVAQPGGRVELEDLGSQNGTFVNGERVDRAVLSDGDLVGIGGVTFRFLAGRLEEYVDRGAAWLAAAGLVVTISGRRLLDEVSFALPPSSLLGIVGPSGAGKTTLLNALTGTRPAEAGRVLYGGRDVYAALDELRGRMGFVPQDDILHPQLTVRQALTYAAELRFAADVDAQQRADRVTGVMAELGLSERADQRISTLSGGQRKRTSVGVELLTRPALLFLDEPTSGLDPANEANLMDLLHDLAADGRCVVVVTHSVQSLDRCDRVLHLAPGGRLAFYGPPAAAPAYFERQGIQPAADEIFRALDSDRSRDWRAAFEADDLHREFVARPLVEAGPMAVTEAQTAADAAPAPIPWLRQLSVLVRRYVAVLRADRGFLALLLLQAPIFGLLFSRLFGVNVFSTLYAIEAGVLLWLIAVGATWLGTSNAIREIVKELPIFRRERAIGLSVSAYLASKVVVLGALTIFQVVIMSSLAMTGHKLPPTHPDQGGLVTPALLAAYGLDPADVAAAEAAMPEVEFDTFGAVFDVPTLELYLGVVACGLAAMALGLLLSAVVRTVDRAATILPLILIVQTVASAPLLGQQPAVLAQLGAISTTNLGLSAMASTVDLNDVRAPFIGVQNYVRAQAEGRGFDPRNGDRAAWRHDDAAWWTNIASMAALAVSSIVAAWFFLRRLDAPRRPRSPRVSGRR